MPANVTQGLPRSVEQRRNVVVSDDLSGAADPARQRCDEPVYFSSGSGLLSGWLHHPSGQRQSSVGLVICKPFGYEALCGHRSIRAFAQMAADLGMPVLRFDYLGTGDSQDIDPAADQIEAWTQDVQAAVARMRARPGVTRVCLMGIRLGALLAALAVARGTEVSELLLMAPVVSGRRYLRELRTTRLIALPETAHAAPPPRSSSPGASEFSGYEMSAATLGRLTQTDLPAEALTAIKHVLIMDRSDFPAARALSEQLAAAGTDVRYSALPGFVEMSMVSPHYAVTPREMLTSAQQWLADLKGVREVQGRGGVPAGDHPIIAAGRSSLPLGDTLEGPVATERPVSFGAMTPLFGIVTEPPPGELRRRAVILLNVGVDYHIGPSRMYVALARRWAQRGYYVLRVDLPGVGDSPALPDRPDNIVYAPNAVEHVYTAAEFMRTRYGIQDLTLAGVCSGAYHALRAAASGLPVERLLLVNPQTFFWKEGMSLDGLTTADVIRNPIVYKRRLVSFDAWRRLLRGEVNLWRIFLVYLRRPWMSLESLMRDCTRALGLRLREDLGRDLEFIVGRGVRLAFAFSPGEIGLELLRLQGGSSVAKLGDRCRVRMLPSGDHTFSQLGPRLILEDVLSEELFARHEPDLD